MKTLLAAAATSLLAAAAAADIPASFNDTTVLPVHHFLVQRRFQRSLDSLEAPAAAKENATNAQFGVRWVQSYVNAQRTVTYSLYEGPSRAAVRAAASANGITIDGITEVPLMLPIE